MLKPRLILILLSASCFALCASAYAPNYTKRTNKMLIQPNKLGVGLESEITIFHGNYVNSLSIRGGSITSLMKRQALLDPATASILAGSIAGAAGVGVAFPLDTLKTKSQVLGAAQTSDNTSGSVVAIGGDVNKMNMFELIGLIYKLEGISGFYGGVKGMMVGQAVIKSVAFSANTSALNYLQAHSAISAVAALLIAACFSGFVTSFLVTPIERIKILLQASDTHANELDCVKHILKNGGILDLFSKGLGCTLTREVPSYGIYFFIYGLMIKTPFAVAMGGLAPLICGAITGMASWIPVYPADVVKTLVQNSDGSDNVSAIEVTKQLYAERGIGGFFDGLTPKMLRAAINHSVTFYIYDLILHSLTA